GWLEPAIVVPSSGKRVAVVGSGPAGLACAEQLARAGHSVTVYERADRIGGLLRYGIPDFKLEKWVIDRRLKLLEAAGISFCTRVEVGRDVPMQVLQAEFDAVVVATGATVARELTVRGSTPAGVHFAMEFLAQHNRRVAGCEEAFVREGWWFGAEWADIVATGKHVVVIGGGDTGSDCVGVSNRQGAKQVTQFQYKPIPSAERERGQPWPFWPVRLRTSSSHEEGCRREWSLSSLEFVEADGRVVGVRTVEVDWAPDGGGMQPRAGTEREWAADLVLLAMGFTGPEQAILTAAGISRKDVVFDKHRSAHQTAVPGTFICGDARRGQSLVVWAISEGREAACEVDTYLRGATSLPRKGRGDLPTLSAAGSLPVLPVG
ncbi:MAG: glutamate synthase subunit beta, partial [Bdellovibrionales bacterium]|nr:glutamate synthase subunit beta [Bdellovibrionales bacterium]